MWDYVLCVDHNLNVINKSLNFFVNSSHSLIVICVKRMLFKQSQLKSVTLIPNGTTSNHFMLLKWALL